MAFAAGVGVPQSRHFFLFRCTEVGKRRILSCISAVHQGTDYQLRKVAVKTTRKDVDAGLELGFDARKMENGK